MARKKDPYRDMEQFEICTVIGCKNMCSYCPQDKIIDAYKCEDKIMSFDTFKKALEKIPRYVRIAFAGMSEPFLNEECIKMVDYAHQNGFRVDIFTTGRGIKLEDIDILKKIPFHYFELHLPDDDRQTEIEVNDYYLKVIKALKDAKLRNFSYKLFGRIHPEVRKAIGTDPEDLTRILHNRAGNLEHLEGKYLKGKIECRYAGKMLNNNILLPNGDITMCDMDYELKYIFGNLLRSDYKDLLNSERFKSFVNALDDPNSTIICRKCDYARRMQNSLDKAKAKWDDSKAKRQVFKVYKKIRRK